MSSPLLTTDPNTAKPRVFGPPHEVVPGVFMRPAFANTFAVESGGELFIVDPGLRAGGPSLHAAVRAWSTAPLAAVLYTHGHFDHAFGLDPFLEAGDTPAIFAQQNCAARFDRYQLTAGWNKTINERQFGGTPPEISSFNYPTDTFEEQATLTVGDMKIELRAAKGETDDHCYAFVPERGYLFTGDLVIWSMPNCGNPQKVQRYPVQWANALDEMAELGAEVMFPGHGLVVQGRHAIASMLRDTSAYLRHLIEQVLDGMNRGDSPEAIFHRATPHPELSQRPFLRVNYDHPKFIVRNLLRLWGGWWNGNAPDLLPAPHEAQAREIAELSGGVAALVTRARARLDEGELALAGHLATWAFQAAPGDAEAAQIVRDVYHARMEATECLMAQGIFRDAANAGRLALKEEPNSPNFSGMLDAIFAIPPALPKK